MNERIDTTRLDTTRLDTTRLDTVEARVAWLEKNVADLDEVLHTLGDDLRQMRLELSRLREAHEAGEAEPGGGSKWEVPPHY